MDKELRRGIKEALTILILSDLGKYHEDIFLDSIEKAYKSAGCLFPAEICRKIDEVIDSLPAVCNMSRIKQAIKAIFKEE